MNLELSKCTHSQVRQMLSSDPVAPVDVAAVQKITWSTKYGASLDQLITDAAKRENAILLVNLASDDMKSPINAYLVAHQAAKMQAALDALSKAIQAKEIICYTTPDTLFTLPGVTTLTGQNSLVLREESALYHMIETGELRSLPLAKNFPSEGYQGRPTVVVDGETLCQIYAATQPDYIPSKIMVIRTDDAALMTEVKIGLALSTLIDEVGMKADKPSLVGGVLGKFVSNEQLAKELVTFDAIYDSIALYEKKDCMADISATIADATQEESCGKCVLCREGAWQIQSIFHDVCSGKAKREDLATITDIGSLIKVGAFCSFGRKMVNAAMSSVELNKTELEEHFVKKNCPANVCKAFAKYVIDPKLCTGCMECLDQCDEDAITGKKGFIHMIDPDLCEACGKCVQSCDEGAIVLAGGSIKAPKKLTKVGMIK